MMTETPYQACLKLARPLFTADFGLAATDPSVLHDLMPQERASLPNAVPKRLNEFSAGRAAAHQAMQELGLEPLPVLHGEDRAPVWPAGVTGGISHTQSVCLSVVGQYGSIGLDVEDAAPLPEDLIPEICTPREQDWLAGQDPVMSRLIFSAKECAYKAQFGKSRRVFGFDALDLRIYNSDFAARFTKDVGPFQKGDTLIGHFAMDSDHIVTAMTLRG